MCSLFVNTNIYLKIIQVLVYARLVPRRSELLVNRAMVYVCMHIDNILYWAIPIP